MFRTLIYPSSGACDCVAELPHRSFCSQFVVCWSFGAAGFGWCSFCRLKPDRPEEIWEKNHSNEQVKQLLRHVSKTYICWVDQVSGSGNNRSEPVYHSRVEI